MSCRVCAASAARMATYFVVGAEFLEHFNDETCNMHSFVSDERQYEADTISLDYTSPVFFWASIEVSLAVACACLPTYRAIYARLIKRPPNPSKGSIPRSDHSGLGFKDRKAYPRKIDTIDNEQEKHTPYQPENQSRHIHPCRFGRCFNLQA